MISVASPSQDDESKLTNGDAKDVHNPFLVNGVITSPGSSSRVHSSKSGKSVKDDQIRYRFASPFETMQLFGVFNISWKAEKFCISWNFYKV